MEVTFSFVEDLISFCYPGGSGDTGLRNAFDAHPQLPQTVLDAGTHKTPEWDAPQLRGDVTQAGVPALDVVGAGGVASKRVRVPVMTYGLEFDYDGGAVGWQMISVVEELLIALQRSLHGYSTVFAGKGYSCVRNVSPFSFLRCVAHSSPGLDRGFCIGWVGFGWMRALWCIEGGSAKPRASPWCHRSALTAHAPIGATGLRR